MKNLYNFIKGIAGKVSPVIWLLLVLVLLIMQIINGINKPARGPIDIKPGPQNVLSVVIAITNFTTNTQYLTPGDALSEINQRRTNSFVTTWNPPVFTWVLPNTFGDRWGQASITYVNPFKWLASSSVMLLPSVSVDIGLAYLLIPAFSFYVGPTIGVDLATNNGVNLKIGVTGAILLQKMPWEK